MTTATLPIGPIGPVSREKQIDRANSIVATAWVKSGAPFRPETQGTGPSDFCRSGAENLGHPKAEGGPVLVILSEEPPPALCDWLLRQGVTGSRIYLLATPSWGSDQLAKELCGSRNARILVRRTPGLPCSAIHGATGGDSIWPGATKSTGGGWCLRLDSAQSDALRQLFLRLFWHHAEDEAWTTGKGQWGFRAPKDRPFDVPPLPETSPVRLVEPFALDLRNLRGETQLVPGDGLPASAPKQLFVPPSGSLHPELSTLASKGASVYWTPLELPRAAWGSRVGILAPATSQWIMKVSLNSAQLQGLENSVSGNPEWSFRQSVGLSGVGSAEVWLPNEQQPRKPMIEQRLPLPDVRCSSIRECVSSEPDRWSPPDPLAMMVSYKWNNMPPVLPTGAQADPLVADWERADEQWRKVIEQLHGKLREGESVLGKMQQSLSKWLGGNLLGFGQSKQQLAEGLEQCRKLKPSTTSRKELVAATDKLKDLASRIQTFTGDLSKSQREGEERQQREQWETDRTRDKQHLDELTTKREAALQNEQGLAEKLAELDKTPENGRDGDWKPRRQKTHDELLKARSTLKALEGEVASLQTKLKEQFVFKPMEGATKSGAAPKGNKFVPQSPSDPAVAMPAFPSEDLPSVGQLFIQQKQRYLAIANWGELDAGEQESTRLKAKLVAKE
jgi:hypothetical protein